VRETVIMPVSVSKAQHEQITSYCQEKGLKKSAWLKNLAIAEIEKNQAIRAGRTQIDPACFQRGQE
jgi:hypothetical protein